MSAAPPRRLDRGHRRTSGGDADPTLQLIAVGFLIAGKAGDAIVPVVTPIGLTLLWLSALLTLYTGWDYFRAGVRHLIED